MKKFSDFLKERCWTGFKSVPGKKPYSPGSCVKESAAAIAAATAIAKKKSGNYDEKGFRKTSYKNPDHPNRKSNTERESELKEDLRKWFSKTDPAGDWKRINSKGEAIGPCAREPGEPKPKCMSRAKRESLTKKERASAVASKRKHDPNPERQGKPINVSNFGKGKISEDMENLDEKITIEEGYFKRMATDKEEDDRLAKQNRPLKQNKPIDVPKVLAMVAARKKMKEEVVQEGRPSQRHPLEGHDYHKKTNAELEYIAKDAHKAAEAMKSHNTTAENKYRDQANDSATVRNFRKTSGSPDWYKKKYGLKEEVDQIDEKNVPTNPELWSRAKSLARSKFDVYPSAYANGWASKWYKGKGGSWKSVSEETEIDEGAIPAKEKTVTVRHKTSGKELVVTAQKAKEYQQQGYHPVKEEKDEREYGYEGDMTLNQLATLIRCGEMIKDMLKPDTDLPEWVQSKITLATDYIQTAADYLYSEMKEEMVNEMDTYPHPDSKEGKALMKSFKSSAKKYPTDLNAPGKIPTVKQTTSALLPMLNKSFKKSMKKEEVDAAIGLAKPKTSLTPAAKTLAPQTRVAEASKPPFDKPYTTIKGTVTDKSGAKHTPMSRARDIARMAMKKQVEKMKQPVKESLDESRRMEIVREAMKVAKKKKETMAADDKYQSEPMLSSQITKT